MNLAKLKYSPNEFQVLGPPELVAAFHNPLEIDFYEIPPDWFVMCAVSGEHIDLRDLNYWCCERQIAFKGPQEVLSFLRQNGEILNEETI